MIKKGPVREQLSYSFRGIQGLDVTGGPHCGVMCLYPGDYSFLANIARFTSGMRDVHE